MPGDRDSERFVFYEALRDQYQYIPFGKLNTDGWSRLMPDPERFPSSAGGAGFKPLADFVHALGLKFGIHIMRGIPRSAAHTASPILGTDVTAAQVADPASVCRWNPDMYGVIWRLASPKGERYAALFNLAETDRRMSAGLDEIGADAATVRQALELWTGERTDISDGTLRRDVKSHGCKLFRFCP